MRKLSRKKVYAIFLLPVVFLLLWSFWFEPNSLMVKNYSLNISGTSGLAPIRVGIISDIHVDNFQSDSDRLNRVISAMNQEKPDVILLLGDFASQKNAVDFAKAAGSLSDLKSSLGTYAVLGNHDWWSDAVLVSTALTKAGVKNIDNQSVKVEWQGKPLQIIGFGDYWEDKNLEEFKNRKFDYTVPTIAITHNPDLFPELNPKPTLLLAGHTHGGQVFLPFVGSPMVPSKFGSKFRYGLFNKDGGHLLVTSGVGTSILPVRFLVLPEIVILDLTFN